MTSTREGEATPKLKVSQVQGLKESQPTIRGKEDKSCVSSVEDWTNTVISNKTIISEPEQYYPYSKVHGGFFLLFIIKDNSTITPVKNLLL